MAYTRETTTEESVAEIGVRSANLTSYILLSKLIAFLLAGFSFIIVVRFLGPPTYGIYVLAAAVAGIFSSVGDLGISTTFSKFVADNRLNKKSRLEKILADGYAILLISGVILTIIAIVISNFLANVVYHSSSLTTPFYLISFSILISMLYTAGYSAVIGFGKGKSAALPVVVEAIFQYVTSILLVLLGFGVYGPIFGLIFGLLAGFIACVIIIHVKSRFRLVMPSVSGMKKMLIFAVPIASSNVLANVVTNIGVVVLGIYVATSIVGNIGIAQNANALFHIVIAAISVTLVPIFSYALTSNKARRKIGDFFNSSIYYAFIFVAPMIFYVAILAKPFSYVAFSGVYNLAPMYIRVMSIGLLLSIVGVYATSLIISTGDTKRVLKYTAITAAIQILLIFTIIPWLKDIGYVIVLFIISPLLTDVLFMGGAVKILNIKINFDKLIRVIVANIIGTTPLFGLIFIFDGNFIPLLIVGAVTTILVYPLALAAMKGIEKGDMRHLRRFSSEIPVFGVVVRALLNYAALLL